MALDIGEEDSVANIMLQVDLAIQYGEDLDVKVPKVRNYLTPLAPLPYLCSLQLERDEMAEDDDTFDLAPDRD